MQSAIQIFEHEAFGSVRTLDKDGELWFVAKDVAAALGYIDTDQAIRNHCKAMQLLKPVDSPGLDIPSRGLTIIPERDLYRLVMRSKLPTAEKFEEWVVSEVLPSVRKHGAYLTPEKAEEIICRPEVVLQLAQQVIEEKQLRQKAEEKIALDAPKVLRTEAVTTSDSTISVATLSNILRQNGVHIGQHRLFMELRDRGFLISQRGDRWNHPKQTYMDRGFFTLHESLYNKSDRSQGIRYTTRVTGKGQEYFINYFLKLREQEKQEIEQLLLDCQYN